MASVFKSGETSTMRKALVALIQADPDLALAREVAGALPDRQREGGFETLMLLIIEQQVSLASARAIWARVKDGIPDLSPEAVLDLTDEDLRGFGLSRPKVRYCRALAEAVVDGSLSLGGLDQLSDSDAAAALISVKGIGRWTAEVYLLFSLGRRDIFPAGDVALQAAAMDVKKLAQRPTEKELYALSEAWRPHRGVAAQLLWRYYGVTRGRADPVSIDDESAEDGLDG
jgi:DNA-3-methyladenine glycosylase II